MKDRQRRRLFIKGESKQTENAIWKVKENGRVKGVPNIKKEAIPTEVRFVVATDRVREGCDDGGRVVIEQLKGVDSICSNNEDERKLQ